MWYRKFTSKLKLLTKKKQPESKDQKHKDQDDLTSRLRKSGF